MAEAQISLTYLKEQLEEELTCGVCLEQYSNPKTLICHHSFCSTCIQALPVVVKKKKAYISCPVCYADHKLPEGGSDRLPSDFKINSLLGLQTKLLTAHSSESVCPKHNIAMNIYCETCCTVICRDCTISQDHCTHSFFLITECFAKHHQQILDQLNTLQTTMADMKTATENLSIRESEIAELGKQLKEQVHSHAQSIIDCVLQSCSHLSEQIDTLVCQKTQLIEQQRQQADRLHSQLKTCQELIEHNLNEWTQHKILMHKQALLDEMKNAVQNADPRLFKPFEKPDMEFKKPADLPEEIGTITGTGYNCATLNVQSCYANQQSTATLILHSLDGSPYPLHPSLISSTLSEVGKRETSTKCDVTQTHEGKYNITFTPLTQNNHYLTVLVGGVDIHDSPLALKISPLPELECKQVTGLCEPCSVAVCENGDIVLIESGAHCVTRVNSKGKILSSFGTKGTKEGEFLHPHRVAVSIDGHLLITDDHRLQKLTVEGVCVKSVGSGQRGNGQLQFNCPHGIAVHPTTGKVFVADRRNNRIQVFTSDLDYYGTINQQELPFKQPLDVAISNKYLLYVADSNNNCISVLTIAGQYLTSFGAPNFRSFFSKQFPRGELFCPSSVAVHNNCVYVSEWANHRVSVFNTDKTFLYCVGEKGSEMEFCKPQGIAVDSLGNLLVSDTNNGRIVVC